MSAMQELYRQVISDHARAPRGKGELAGATHTAIGDNPSCGDRVAVQLRLDGEVIGDVRFSGRGCAISQASASMLTGLVRGRTRAEALALAGEFEGMLRGTAPKGDLGDLMALQGTAQLHSRVKCAVLAWEALREALAE